MDRDLIKLRIQIEKNWPGKFTKYFQKFAFECIDTETVGIRINIESARPTIVYNKEHLISPNSIATLISIFWMYELHEQLEEETTGNDSGTKLARQYAAQVAAIYRIQTELDIECNPDARLPTTEKITALVDAKRIMVHELLHAVYRERVKMEGEYNG